MMLGNPFGMYIAWGKNYTQLYNDAFRKIIGPDKHPVSLGNSPAQTFSEIWHITEPMFNEVMNGKSINFPDFVIPLNRNGVVETCYFDFSYSPIKKEDGEVGGVLVTVIETTAKKKAAEKAREASAMSDTPDAACAGRAGEDVATVIPEGLTFRALDHARL